jgi:hypothetical protein
LTGAWQSKFSGVGPLHKIIFLLIFIGMLPLSVEAEDNSEDFAKKWQSRATRTQAKQPKWSVPMVAPFPMLAQVYRTDFTHQSTPTGAETWNLGSGKGFNLIPFANTQIDILTPGYVLHSDNAPDGFGDISFLAKYRFFSANEQHGNYIMSGAVAWSFPSGSYKNGAATATITPTLLGGKGFGRLALMSSLGGNLPTSDARTNGRTIHANTVAQYHLGKYLWPEVEFNTTSYLGGTRDGKTQTFITPGLMVGKFALRPESAKSRMGLAAGVAFQTALTSFHTYNHAVVVSLRFGF